MSSVNTQNMQRVSRSGQISIPKKIREQADLKEGDYIEAVLTREGILLKVLDLTVRVNKLN